MNSVYPIGLATCVELNQVVAAHCGAQEFAVWRDSKGVLHANQNRCPHRGMRLSFGFVREDRLNCLYHGWSYDGGGQCRHIPAHPQLTPPKTICLQTYAVRERHALVWLAVDDNGAAALETWLDRVALPEGAEATPVRSLYVEADAASVRRAMATLFVPPFTGSATGAELVDDGGESATWSVDGRHRDVSYLRTLACPAVGTVAVRGEELPLQGLLYALQDTGNGRIGVHLAALWAGAAPAAYRAMLSRHLRRVEWFLRNPNEPAAQWRAFAAG